ncbi:hypothetical protein AWENTII_007182 [Aspergillus wentii]
MANESADEYSTSEDLLGKWFAANPDKRNDIFLATKFGIKMTPDQQPRFRVDSSPEYCREAIHSSLKRLGVPYKLIVRVPSTDNGRPSINERKRSLYTSQNQRESARLSPSPRGRHINCAIPSARRKRSQAGRKLPAWI